AGAAAGFEETDLISSAADVVEEAAPNYAALGIHKVYVLMVLLAHAGGSRVEDFAVFDRNEVTADRHLHAVLPGVVNLAAANSDVSRTLDLDRVLAGMEQLESVNQDVVLAVHPQRFAASLAVEARLTGTVDGDE